MSISGGPIIGRPRTFSTKPSKDYNRRKTLGDGYEIDFESLKPLEKESCSTIIVRKNMVYTTNYNYTIHDGDDIQLFYASENEVQYYDSTDARKRTFDMEISDVVNDNISILFHRDRAFMKSYKLFGCGQFCKFQVDKVRDNISVHIPDRNGLSITIGYVRQGTGSRPVYEVRDYEGKLHYLLCGPKHYGSPIECTFEIREEGGSDAVGFIKPHTKESLVDRPSDEIQVDHYSIIFPTGISTILKAVVLAGSFLLNVMFFSFRIDSRLLTFHED